VIVCFIIGNNEADEQENQRKIDDQEIADRFVKPEIKPEVNNYK